MGQKTMENSENRNKPASPVNVMVSDNYIFQDELQRCRHMDYKFFSLYSTSTFKLFPQVHTKNSLITKIGMYELGQWISDQVLVPGFWSLGSAGEVEAQLYVALDQGYINQERFDSIRSTASSTKKLIAGFMNYLKRSNLKGQKYK
jgi:hypothetical protein